MAKKTLIIHIPVVHKGFLDFFKNTKDEVSDVYIIDEKFLPELTEFKPDIASFGSETTKDLLNKFGFENIKILSKENLSSLGEELMLIKDEVSRNLAEKFLKNKNIVWKDVFLRIDREKVLIQQNLEDIPVSEDVFEVEMMQETIKESKKTGDWWRQIGAVLVRDKNIILRAYNKDLPSDHTAYQLGEPRDFFKPGERHDLASTIHAEQSIIAQAAKEGISVGGLSMYVTTFPCPVCAKMIACSGIKNVYFGEGGSNFDARRVLESAGVIIIHVPIK